MSDVQRHVTNNDLRAWLGDQFVNTAQRTAANLREVADMIEVRAAQIQALPLAGTTNAGQIAARIVSDVTSGLANAGLDAIVSAAARYDHEVKP